MRPFPIMLSLAVALFMAMSLSGNAQSASAPSPQQPAAAPAQSAPTQSAPSQTAPAPSTPAQTEPRNDPHAAPAQPQAQSEEENPLHLTDEQKAKLRPILIEQNQQMDALRNDASMTQEQKIAKANAIREAATPKIRAILTQEQLQKLADMQQKAKQNPPAQEVPKK